MSVNNGAGPLRQVLEAAAYENTCGMKDLTVLSLQRDPYRLDTHAGHRDGAWFAQMVERFVGGSGTVHLRGLHYRVSTAGGVQMPNGKPYVNTDECWEWLCGDAAKAARWLGYVAFERIVDERNAPPELFVAEAGSPNPFLSCGSRIELPLSLEQAFPEFICAPGFPARQPYRIILFGEKTSLGPVLRPIAQMVGGEMLLPTGEASETMVAELAARAALDGRQAVVLYFSDFDPSGRQMAVSVARKLQALHDLLHPDLAIELHPVALTLVQIRELRLPSTPLKEKERRADRWRAVMGHEQTEIDALAALAPDTLEEIAEEAIRPFYDASLAARTERAQRQWERDAAELLEAHPAYSSAQSEIETALDRVRLAVEEFHAVQDTAQSTLESEVEPPAIVVPEAQIDAEAPKPLFSTEDDFFTASRRLIAHKALEGGEQ
jgi:hypothetical protein